MLGPNFILFSTYEVSINYRPEGNYKAGQGRQYHEYPPGVEHEAAALPAEMVRDHKPGQPSHADITDLKYSAVTLKRGFKKKNSYLRFKIKD